LIVVELFTKKESATMNGFLWGNGLISFGKVKYLQTPILPITMY